MNRLALTLFVLGATLMVAPSPAKSEVDLHIPISLPTVHHAETAAAGCYVWGEGSFERYYGKFFGNLYNKTIARIVVRCPIRIAAGSLSPSDISHVRVKFYSDFTNGRHEAFDARLCFTHFSTDSLTCSTQVSTPLSNGVHYLTLYPPSGDFSDLYTVDISIKMPGTDDAEHDSTSVQSFLVYKK